MSTYDLHRCDICGGFMNLDHASILAIRSRDCILKVFVPFFQLVKVQFGGLRGLRAADGRGDVIGIDIIDAPFVEAP